MRQGRRYPQKLVFGRHMRCNSQPACFGSGNRLAQHGKSRCACPAGALGDALQGAGKWQHRRRNFDATEGRILGGNKKIAGQRKLEPAAECDAPHHGDGRYLEHFNSAIGSVYLSHERSEPVHILSRPFAHFAAEAEVRTL
jgi:hypothetical protein